MSWNRASEDAVLLTTTDFVPGREIDHIIGLVVGAVKLESGGTNKVEERTAESIERLIEAAHDIGADAVIDVHINPIQPAGQGGNDKNYSILCYGTAVRLKSAH